MQNPTKSKITKMSHTEYYKLCEWIKIHADDLLDAKYDQRAKLATEALGFPVTDTKAKEASELVECRHEVGRINAVYFAMVALCSSGGFTIANMAKKGREHVRQMQARAAGAEETMELFPDMPELSEDEMPEAGPPEEDGIMDQITDPEPESEYSAPEEIEDTPPGE